MMMTTKRLKVEMYCFLQTKSKVRKFTLIHALHKNIIQMLQNNLFKEQQQ